jgi:hypothetical protein
VSIINQYDRFGILRPVNFYTQKSSPAKWNYDTYDRKVLSIVEPIIQWRNYLEGSNHKVLIQSNHKNLKYFQTSNVLSSNQTR